MGEVKALRLLLSIDLRNHYWRYSIPLKNAASLEFCYGSDHWTSTEIQASRKQVVSMILCYKAWRGMRGIFITCHTGLVGSPLKLADFMQRKMERNLALCADILYPSGGLSWPYCTLCYSVWLWECLLLCLLFFFSISRQQFWIGFGCPSPHCVRAVWRTPTCHLKDFYSVQKIFQAKKFLSNDNEWNWRKWWAQTVQDCSCILLLVIWILLHISVQAAFQSLFRHCNISLSCLSRSWALKRLCILRSGSWAAYL